MASVSDPQVAPTFTDNILNEVQSMNPLKFAIIYMFTTGLPTFSICLASCVILSLYWNAACDGSMMPLPVWLLVFFIFESLYLVKSAVSAYNRQKRSAAMVYACGVVGNQVFLIIWNIVGAVALFRDAPECQYALYSLWAMVLAILCLQWISMGCHLCLFCCCGAKMPK